MAVYSHHLRLNQLLSKNLKWKLHVFFMFIWLMEMLCSTEDDQPLFCVELLHT